MRTAALSAVQRGRCAVWQWVFPELLTLSCSVTVAKSTDPGPPLGGQSDVEVTLPACALWLSSGEAVGGSGAGLGTGRGWTSRLSVLNGCDGARSH